MPFLHHLLVNVPTPVQFGHHQGYIEENKAEFTPRFFELAFKVTYDFRTYSTITLQFNAGIGNILNSYQRDFGQGSDRDSGYIYGPGMPRTDFVGIVSVVVLGRTYVPPDVPFVPAGAFGSAGERKRIVRTRLLREVLIFKTIPKMGVEASDFKRD